MAPPGKRLGARNYERFLAGGDAEFASEPPGDEWDAISPAEARRDLGERAMP